MFLKEKLFSFLDANGPTSISEISRSLKENKEYISGYLHGLAAVGLLEVKTVGRAKVFLRKKDGNRTTVQRFSVNTERKQTEI